MILSFIPTNIFSSLTSGSMMPIIVFSALLGIASLHLNKANQVSLFSFFDAISNVMLLIATWVIKLTPIGVFSLISYLVATQGLGSVLELWSYVLMVLFVLLVHGGVTLPILLKAFTKINPYKYFNQIKEVPLTAFSTASSAATLPMSLKVSQEKGEVSQKTASFVLPLGATVSMDGTAAYLSIAVLFIANISGIQLSFFDQVLLGITVVSLSIGVAALPSASLVMMIVILNQLGLPVEYIAVIFAVDRILDMARTSLNVTSDMFVAKIIDTISSTKTK
jgi:Na+/H+-dicarboxylate symporter